VYFFNAHFSYVVNDALKNANDTIAYIRRIVSNPDVRKIDGFILFFVC